MIEEVGSYPHNMSNSSPVIYGDLIYLSTSNGQDESHVHIPSPQAPSIIALNKNTGKLVWEDNSVEDRILHGQWSTPAVGTIGGVVQVVSAQGDGWVRGYEAESGKKLWEFDTNPKDCRLAAHAQRADRDAGDLSGPRLHRQRTGSGARRRRRPSLRDRRHQARRHHQDRARLALRQDPPIDLDGRDRRWPASTFRTSAATCTASTRRPARSTGRTTCSPPSGRRRSSSTARSTSATRTATSSSWRTARRRRCSAEMNMGSAVYGTIVPANGALFINNRSQLFAIAAKKIVGMRLRLAGTCSIAVWLARGAVAGLGAHATRSSLACGARR